MDDSTDENWFDHNRPYTRWMRSMLPYMVELDDRPEAWAEYYVGLSNDRLYYHAVPEEVYILMKLAGIVHSMKYLEKDADGR